MIQSSYSPRENRPSMIADEGRPVMEAEIIDDCPSTRIRVALGFVDRCNQHFNSKPSPVVDVHGEFLDVFEAEMPPVQEYAFRQACRLIANYFSEGLPPSCVEPEPEIIEGEEQGS